MILWFLGVSQQLTPLTMLLKATALLEYVPVCPNGNTKTAPLFQEQDTLSLTDDGILYVNMLENKNRCGWRSL